MKLGDRVKIIADSTNHGFEIGEVIVVGYSNHAPVEGNPPGEWVYEPEDDQDSEPLRVSSTDIELVEFDDFVELNNLGLDGELSGYDGRILWDYELVGPGEDEPEKGEPLPISDAVFETFEVVAPMGYEMVLISVYDNGVIYEIRRKTWWRYH